MRSQFLSALLLSISAATLVACSGGQSKGIETAKTSVPMPPETLMESTLTESDTLTPVMTADAPSNAATSAAAMPLSTPPMVSPATSMAVEERIARLEETVGSLRRDYDRIMPAFASLNTTNERIQTLLDEIETQTPPRVMGDAEQPAIAPTTTIQKTVEATQTDVITPSAEVMAAMDRIAPPAGTVVKATTETKTTTTTVPTVASKGAAPAAPSPTPSAPAVTTTPAAITETAKGVRIGEHGSKTRIVVDLGGNMKPDAKFDLDNAEKLLLVDLPATAWVGDKAGTPKNSAFVSGWSVQDAGSGGAALAIQLKKGAKILSTEYLKASGKDGARLVIDIGPAA